MKLAIVGWINDSGLGYEARDALKNLPVECAFVLHNHVKATVKSELAGIPCVYATTNPANPRELKNFLDRHKPDTVLSWEIPGNWEFPKIYKERGIKWVHVVHWDWFFPQHLKEYRMAHRLIAPNELCQRELLKHRLSTTFLPVPIDLNRFPFKQRTKAERFISVAGFGGSNGRRGLGELLMAWENRRILPNPPKLVIPAQRRPHGNFRKSHRYVLDVNPVKDPAELWAKADIAIQISRFEGVGLTFMEAQACGVPTIATDAEPMNWLAPFLKAPVHHKANVSVAGKDVVANIIDPEKLALMVKKIRGTDISELSLRGRRYIEENFSWQVLKEKWMAALA